MGVVWLNCMYISLSFIGSTVIMCLMSLLLITMATPCVYCGFMGFSPLKYHMNSFLFFRALCFVLVSCIITMSILFFFIHVSTSSLVPGLLVPLMFSVASLNCLYCFIFGAGCPGYRAVALGYFSVSFSGFPTSPFCLVFLFNCLAILLLNVLLSFLFSIVSGFLSPLFVFLVGKGGLARVFGLRRVETRG